MRYPHLGLVLLIVMCSAQGCIGELGVGTSDDVNPGDGLGIGPNILNASQLAFEPAPDDWVAPLNKEILSAALLDATGDKILDVVVLTADGVEVLEGDGRAGFALPIVDSPMEPSEPPVDPPVDPEPPVDPPEPEPSVHDILGADLNADGLDELVTCQGAKGALSVYPDGLILGASASTPARPFGCVMLVAGDLNGDGEQDVVELLDMGKGATAVSAWRLLNSGQLEPLLTAERLKGAEGAEGMEGMEGMEGDELLAVQELSITSPTAALVRDFNGDGRAELLIAQDDKISSFSLVNGKLQSSLVMDGLKKIKVLSALDIDGDGDLDLHVGIQGNQDRLFLSDGQGRFAEATWSMLPVEDSFSVSSVVVDLNADGRSDLIMGTSQGFDRLYIGDRGRLLDTSPKLGFVDTKTLTMFAGDLDGDEDLDLISVGRDGRLRIFARQAEASNKPSKTQE